MSTILPSPAIGLKQEDILPYGARQEYYTRLWLPQVLHWDFEVAGNGFIRIARVPIRRGEIRTARLYSAGGEIGGGATFQIYAYWLDYSNVAHPLWLNAADRIGNPAATGRFYVEKAPTTLDRIVDVPLNRAHFEIEVTNFVGAGSWPGVTFEVILDPIT